MFFNAKGHHEIQQNQMQRGRLKSATFNAQLSITQQVALLWQRDRATRFSVEILQLQNIPFEN